LPRIARRADDSAGRQIHRPVWKLEIRCIEKVEELRTKLQSEALPDRKLFECREVKVHQLWSPENIAAGGAEVEWVCSRRALGNESGLVEPPRMFLLGAGQNAAADAIGPDGAAGSGVRPRIAYDWA